MPFKLRTTICINMLVLMIAAIGLISVVVFRVSEREIRRQQEHTAEQVFMTIAAIAGELLNDTSALHRETFSLNDYFNRLTAELNCDMLVLTDRNSRVLASIGNEDALPIPAGHAGARTLIHSTQRNESRTVVRHVCAGPVTAGTRVLGFLTLGFPAAQANERISAAARMIILYMVLDGIIIFCFGMLLLSRYVVRPVRRLSLEMLAMAGGVLPRMQAPSSGSEIDALAATLKALHGELRHEQQQTAAQLAEITAKNRQLEQAQHEILQSEKMASVGHLAAGIAHEIGNPAGILTGYIHMLRQGGISREQAEDFLARMEREVDRISTTIRELLDFAQPASAQAAPVQFNELIKSCCALFDYQRDSRTCTITFEPGQELPDLYANERMLQQLIVNMMLNARDAMPDGGTITISTRLLPEEPIIEISIADTGIGIAPEHLDRIFDPFFTTKDPGRGTGLGLSNALRIVELHNGSISVDSEPGRGTRFTLRFPIHTEQP
jgi:two-component system, NtrC family, sensor kinase